MRASGLIVTRGSRLPLFGTGLLLLLIALWANREHPGIALRLELRFSSGMRVPDRLTGVADTFAGGGPGGRRQRPDLAVGEGER
jgi:hypothetical protein